MTEALSKQGGNERRVTVGSLRERERIKTTSPAKDSKLSS